MPPIWATQWGWNTLPETWRGLPSIWGSVTPQQQIEYTLGALDRIQAEWPWMGPAISASLESGPTPPIIRSRALR
ncbi:MAG: hypothetical protein HND48_10520 [Chloroflexi bacterium]|nr:hypothetical protein [Chloroflexota bacterium]